MIKFIHFEDTFKPEWQDFVKVGDIVEANRGVFAKIICIQYTTRRINSKILVVIKSNDNYEKIVDKFLDAAIEYKPILNLMPSLIEYTKEKYFKNSYYTLKT
jgi:hypothetical protein